jgi:hypothetical protein
MIGILLSPAIRNLFEKTPLRGGAFAEHCRCKMLQTEYRLLVHFKYCIVRYFPDFQRLFIKLMKSFCRGVQGGQFFQKAPPLVAEGEK